MSIELVGMDKLISALRRADTQATQALQDAMVDEMDAVMEDAKRRTPVDTGTLRASGTVLPAERRGSQIVVEAGFGGAAADYAIVQHEDTSLSHGVGEAKFLEKAMNERAGRMPHNLAVRIAASLSRLR